MVKTCRECAELKEVEVEAKIGTDEDTRDSRLGRRHLRCGPADLLDSRGGFSPTGEECGLGRT